MGLHNGITRIITTVAAIFRAVFAVIQILHMEKHWNADIFMKLFEWEEDDRLRRAFRWVANESQFEDYEKYKAQGKTRFKLSEYPYEGAAFFEQRGFLIEKCS